MRTRLGISISLVILVTTGGALLTTSASGQTVVHVVYGPAQDIRATFADLHRDGLRLGERMAARGPLLNDAQTDQVGTGYHECLVQERITALDRGLWNCTYVRRDVETAADRVVVDFYADWCDLANDVGTPLHSNAHAYGDLVAGTTHRIQRIKKEDVA